MKSSSFQLQLPNKSMLRQVVKSRAVVCARLKAATSVPVRMVCASPMVVAVVVPLKVVIRVAKVETCAFVMVVVSVALMKDVTRLLNPTFYARLTVVVLGANLKIATVPPKVVATAAPTVVESVACLMAAPRVPNVVTTVLFMVVPACVKFPAVCVMIVVVVYVQLTEVANVATLMVASSHVVVRVCALLTCVKWNMQNDLVEKRLRDGWCTYSIFLYTHRMTSWMTLCIRHL